jgi:glycosyltransferase involved in cell wall biosynthesis
MHIGINAQLLSISQNYRNGGVSRYIRYLLTELAQRPGEHVYTVFVNGREIIEHLPQNDQIDYVSAPWPEAQPLRRVLWEQFVLPTQLRQKRIDVLHSPVNVLPEHLPERCASVVTLHDMAFLRYPHVLTHAKRLYHRTFTVRSMRRANMLIAVSNSTKQDAHELAGVPLARMRTIYPCIDERFSPTQQEDVLEDFRQQKGLNDGYLLFLSTLEPRKNVTTLIEAYHLLRQRYAVREKLVLAGGKGWLYDEIFTRVQQLDLQDHVVFAGYVKDTEHVRWYQAAAAFVLPSLYEGFGFPVAEALACGTPTVTSNISSLPEAGAQLALCVDPHNVEALAEAMQQAITDPVLRERCHHKAPDVARLFSAQRMARQTTAVYQEAARQLLSRHTSIVG